MHEIDQARIPRLSGELSEPDEEFVRLSARIGADPMLVQGGGGNTSVKNDGGMWVKASGTWLAEAGRRQIFVCVSLEKLREDLAHESDTDFGSMASSTGLRPSIETSLHAVLPHRVVAHYHSVNAIATAVRHDAVSLLPSLLSGLRWVWVPYRRPGLPLALAAQERLTSTPADVLVLGNHGLIVGGSTSQETWSLVCELERRLQQQARPSPEPDIATLQTISSGSPYLPAENRVLHAVAIDSISLEIARKGSLYPDHVVFLGPAVRVLQKASRGEELAELAKANVPLVAVPGKGVLVHRSLTRGQKEMANCLALVLPRIPIRAPVNYLSAEQETQLLNWQAEAYRKAMDA